VDEKGRSTVSEAAASAAGALLAVGTRGLAALRSARKPLHPSGNVRAGRLVRGGSDEPTGVDWLDEPGEDEVVVRLSRAIGLPRPLPDIHGLALRVYGARGGDLLFATTGRGHLTRFLLTASRDPRGRPLTTLLPYRTDSGALLISAVGLDAETYELAWGRPLGDWHTFATLHLSPPPGGDPGISFDPVRRQLAGLRQYPAVERLREPAYLRARRSRTTSEPPPQEAN
jgi:hypothetical protein